MSECGNNVVNFILILAVFEMGQWAKYIFLRKKHDKKGAKNLVIFIWYQIKRNWQPCDNVLGLVTCDVPAVVEDGGAG